MKRSPIARLREAGTTYFGAMDICMTAGKIKLLLCDER